MGTFINEKNQIVTLQKKPKRRKKMNKKGQGALEYLLLIGGAVLVAAIVIALITGVPTGTGNPEAKARCAAHATYNGCIGDTGFTIGSTTFDCVAKKTDGSDATGASDFGYCTAEEQ